MTVPKKWKLSLFLLSFISLISSANAQTWPPKSFYTDDSSYYLRLFKDGFEQRFHIANTDCSQIDRAELILSSSNKSDLIYPMYQLEDNKDSSSWELPFGVDAQTCWFQGRVSDRSLEERIHYTIKLYSKNSNLNPIFFNGVTDSLIPYKRFSTNLQSWIPLGALGATPVNGGGTYFKVWEPEAERVDIKINQKDTYTLNLPLTQHKVHTLYLEDVQPGAEYTFHYVKNGEYEELGVGNHDQVSTIKVDPMAKEIIYDQKGGYTNSYVNPRAIVADSKEYSWQYTLSENERADQNWIIYQVWPLTFNPKKENGRYQPGKFTDIQEKLDYFTELGVTAVEFLPVHESRFHASWGYALDSFTLIEKNYGTSKELKDLIDQLHKKKLKVLFDVVLNHINNSLLRDPLSKSRHKTKFYGGNTDWGPKPNFSSVMARKWMSDSILNLVRDYQLDGLRFDMIEHIYKGDAAGYKFLQELNLMLKMINPHLYSSAEQLPDNVWATYSQTEGGLGFDSQWNDKFKNFFELKFDHYRHNQRGIDLSALIGSLNGYSNQSSGYGEYHFGGAPRTVNYLGSHDVVGNKNPFLRIISDFSSYESSGDNFFTRVNPLEIPYPVEREAKFRMIHNPFNHQAALTSYGVLFTKPGATLFFQGEELAGDLNIENEWSYLNAKENNSIPTVNVDLHRYISSHRVQWEYLELNTANLSFLREDEKDQFRSYHQMFKDFIQFKKNHPEINDVDALDVHYLQPGVLSYRIDRGPEEFFVIINYSYDISNFWVQFPGTSTDWWHEDIALSQSKYGQGKNKFRNIIANVGGRFNNVRIPGPGVTIFTKKKHALVQDQLYLRSNLHNWNVKDAQKLVKSSDGGELYSATIEVPSSFNQDFRFKLGTSDWSIDLGVDDTLTMTEAAFLGDQEGYLTYNPDKGDAVITLSPGQYRFIFNLNTFKYNFIKL